jgi:hypothetical protein
VAAVCACRPCTCVCRLRLFACVWTRQARARLLSATRHLSCFMHVVVCRVHAAIMLHAHRLECVECHVMRDLVCFKL